MTTRVYTIAGVIAGIFLVSSVLVSTMSVPAYANIALSGQGATFPDPLIQLWIDKYELVRPFADISYTPLGSGAGITGITNELVNWGASEAPLSVSEQATFATHGTPLTMPVTVGTVTVAINHPNLGNNELRLTGKVIGDIFLGKIKTWNHNAIKGLQTPAVQAKLTGDTIVTVHRCDSSGTTFVFTEYLTKTNSEWASKVGTSKAPTWPAAATQICGDGNAGVAAGIESTNFSLGYLELSFAVTENIDTALVKNKAAKWIAPSLSSGKAAITNYVGQNPLPKGDESWAGVSTTNPGGGGSYPITSFSYYIFFEESKDNGQFANLAEAKEFKKMLNWKNGPGQGFADDLTYVPLPFSVKQNNINTLKMMEWNGVQIAVAPTGPPS
jgi:phosphate ABC transporter phosphate-binding protein